MFNRDIKIGSKKYLKHIDQESTKEIILDLHREKIKDFNSKINIDKYLKNSEKNFKDLSNKLIKIFPKAYFSLSSRIKDSESISQNVKWGNRYTLVDILGFRIVPKQTSSLPKALKDLETLFGKELSFKFNIFSYSLDEIVQRISKNSIYYRAFHYHFPFNEYFVEVQVRTKGVDQWANLNHDTMYKKKIEITSNEEKQIMDFGKIANIVDYYDLLLPPQN